MHFISQHKCLKVISKPLFLPWIQYSEIQIVYICWPKLKYTDKKNTWISQKYVLKILNTRAMSRAEASQPRASLCVLFTCLAVFWDLLWQPQQTGCWLLWLRETCSPNSAIGNNDEVQSASASQKPGRMLWRGGRVGFPLSWRRMRLQTAPSPSNRTTSIFIFFISFFYFLPSRCGCSALNSCNVPVVPVEARGQHLEPERRREAAARGLRGVHAAHRLAAVRLHQHQTLRREHGRALHHLLPDSTSPATG